MRQETKGKSRSNECEIERAVIREQIKGFMVICSKAEINT